MQHEIIVSCVSGNLVGRGPLADKYTFDYYSNLLTNMPRPFIFDGLIPFIPRYENYVDAFFLINSVLSAKVSEEKLNVTVNTFYMRPVDSPNLLHVYKCEPNGAAMVESINLVNSNR